MKQKFDVTIVIDGRIHDFIATDLKTKDNEFHFWDCEKSEWRGYWCDLNTAVTIKLHKEKVLYGVEYDQDERKFKTFEHDETFAPFGDHIVMNNGMTEEDAAELCWKYNQVRL